MTQFSYRLIFALVLTLFLTSFVYVANAGVTTANADSES